MKIQSLIAAMVLTIGLSGVAIAQDRPEGERGDRRERWERFQRERGDGGERPAVGGERGGFDPQQFRQRSQEQLKQQLQVSDEEWEVLQPKIERVQTATAGARGGMGMMGGRGGGPGGPGGPGQRGDSELVSASRELRTALQSETASEQEISRLLATYRAAREKAQTELETARTELRDLLTERQEAVLVLAGVLE